jgi:hypothetical protein
MIGCNWWAFELLKIEKLGARRLEKKYPENKCSAEEIVILQKKNLFFYFTNFVASGFCLISWFRFFSFFKLLN